MLETNQLISFVNVPDILGTTMPHDCAESIGPPRFHSLGDAIDHQNVKLIKSAPTVEGRFSQLGTTSLIPWSYAFAEYFTHVRDVTSVQYSIGSVGYFPYPAFIPWIPIQESAEQPATVWSISPQREVVATTITKQISRLFDFDCNVVSDTAQVLAQYVSESERKARAAWKRFCRKNSCSSAVSKDGHLSFLVPRYEEVCVETAARDHVLHLEVITLTEEQETPAIAAVGQMLISGGKTWKRWRNRLSSLLLKSLRKTRLGGYIACGLAFESIDRLLQY
jgi:hypothetical protein